MYPKIFDSFAAPHIPKLNTTRRGFLLGALVTAGGPFRRLSLEQPRRRARPAQGPSVPALCGDRARRQGYDLLLAIRDGPGRILRHRHAGERGTRRRLAADHGRGRFWQSRRLRQSRLGRCRAGYGRFHVHDIVMGTLPHRRCCDAHDAGRGSRERMGRPGILDRRGAWNAGACLGKDRHLWRDGGESRRH